MGLGLASSAAAVHRATWRARAPPLPHLVRVTVKVRVRVRKRVRVSVKGEW